MSMFGQTCDQDGLGSVCTLQQGNVKFTIKPMIKT